MEIKRKRVILVSAYGCEPFKGSEAGVGWNWVLQMAKNDEVHVITRKNNKEAIENNIPNEIQHNLRFYYYDTSNLFLKFKKRDKGIYLYNIFWQIGIISLIKRLKRENIFDYSMHLSFGSFWMPTFLPFFKIPFIWGPLGGGECVPKTFLKEFPFKQRVVQKIRYWLIATSFLNPLVVFPCKKAAVILVRTNNSLEIVPKRFRYKAKVVLETAMENEVFKYKRNVERKNDNVFKIISTGRLVPFKNIVSSIRAISLLDKGLNIQYKIIGIGHERKSLIKEIENYGLQGKVEILNEMSRVEILHELANSDVYLFPSLREGGTWALMEAMAIGLPCICLNWTGMNIITSEDSAFRLEVTNPNQMPIDIASVLCKIIENRNYANQIGDNARQRIMQQFNWNQKGSFMKDLFYELEKGRLK